MSKTVYLIKYQPENLDLTGGVSDKSAEEMKLDIEKWLGPQRIQNGFTAVVESKGEGRINLFIETLGLNGEFPHDETRQRYIGYIIDVLLNHCKLYHNGTGQFFSKSNVESLSFFKSLFDFRLLDETK